MVRQPGLSSNPAHSVSWAKDGNKHVCMNTKRSFSGFKAGPEECILAFRLAKDRTKDAAFSFSSNSISVSAVVRKGGGREICQDAAFVYDGPKYKLLGVVDGFGPDGAGISAFVAEKALELAAAGHTDPLAGVIGAMHPIPGPESRGKRSGATAAFVKILPDGSFVASSISDSAVFRLINGDFRRLLRGYDFNHRGEHVGSKELGEYFRGRHTVSKVLMYGRDNRASVYLDGGILYPGEGLILCTDGLTKNLAVAYDPASGNVLDNSGCGDMSSLLERTKSPQEATRALLSAIRSRLRIPRKSGTHIEMGDSRALYPDADDVAIVAACI